jgi:hypothetical protein
MPTDSLKLGGRYGNVGVEIVDAQDGHVVAVVNRAQENRRRSLRESPVSDERERDRRDREASALDASLTEAIHLALAMAAAPDLIRYGLELVDLIEESESDRWDAIASHREALAGFKDALRAAGYLTAQERQRALAATR